MADKDIVWPRPKKSEEDSRVKTVKHKDYEHMRITDKKDGKNGKNLNS